MESANKKAPTILEISNLKKRYDTPEGAVQTVIDIPSFSLPRDQVALRGESGTGKTRLLRTMHESLNPKMINHIDRDLSST